MFQMFTIRQFQCRECFHIGPLDTHACCNECGSMSVIRQELLSSHERENLLALARSA